MHLWRLDIAEYGNRVGAWRLLDLFQEFNLPCALLLNSQLYHHCPELMAYADSLGHEVVAHSRTNSEWQVITLQASRNMSGMLAIATQLAML